ncbi:MAG: hypothetical protein HYX61_01005 [Gammaproteobacteria bacterium]|nr:hypothetical protein [Gammaproteobacteria bacterium]
MSNKGVDALPTWVKALVDPDSLARLRSKQIKQHHMDAIEQLTRNQEQGLDRINDLSSPISLKQKALAAIHGLTIVKDNFSVGHEIEWIQLLKSIDKKDDDPSHQNRDTFYLILQSTHVDQASKQLDAEVVSQTENLLHKVRKNIDPEFPNALIESLTNSPSQSLIVELVDSNNKKNAMGIVILQAQNGIWLHDPKLGCSFCCDNKNIQDFKDFFAQHLKANYPDCNTASIIQLGIKPKNEADLKAKSKDPARRIDTVKFSNSKPDPSLSNPTPHFDDSPKPKNKKSGPSV